MSDPDVEREFMLDHHELAEFLSEVAESIEQGEVALDGDGWKAYHEVHEDVPMRVVVDEDGLEIGIKLLRDEDT
nr:MAG: hypothetical protein J07AB56_06250 [Candidatus Nanosalinarum sp. J07AB56]